MTDTHAPIRVRLSRRKGWRMPERTVNVARPTKWGNPFTIMEWGLPLALELYARSIRGLWTPDGIPDMKLARAYALATSFRKKFAGHPLEQTRELRGYNLACWCPADRQCHADILLEIANG